VTLGDWAAMASAPQRVGTTYEVRAKPVGLVGGAADHMFETFDDGQHQYIFRGGPHWPFLHAQVDPADQSPDYGADSRVVARGFLPGQTAEQAIAPAQRDAAEINGAHAIYGLPVSNSNTVIGDFTKHQYGQQAGDARTWGYQSQFAPWPAPDLSGIGAAISHLFPVGGE
jgi:hypothetical protein